MKLPRESEKNLCPMEVTLSVIGGKWKLHILHYIAQGVNRPSDLERNIKSISKRVLSKQIQELLANGLIYKKIHSTIPPKVEYFLTEKGKTLAVIIQNLNDWGSTYYKS